MANYQEVSTNVLQRQFGYTNVAALMIERAKVFDQFLGDIVGDLVNQFFNIDECLPVALDNYWGKLLGITRVFEDGDGNVYTLTDDEFREIIKIKLFFWDGSLISLNEFFRDIFKDRGTFFAVDTQDMTMIKFVIGFALTANEIAMFTKFDIFPRPAGIGTKIQIIPADQKYFGFESINQYTESPVTVGFGSCFNGNPTGDGKTATIYDEV